MRFMPLITVMLFFPPCFAHSVELFLLPPPHALVNFGNVVSVKVSSSAVLFEPKKNIDTVGKANAPASEMLIKQSNADSSNTSKSASNKRDDYWSLYVALLVMWIVPIWAAFQGEPTQRPNVKVTCQTRAGHRSNDERE